MFPRMFHGRKSALAFPGAVSDKVALFLKTRLCSLEASMIMGYGKMIPGSIIPEDEAIHFSPFGRVISTLKDLPTSKGSGAY